MKTDVIIKELIALTRVSKFDPAYSARTREEILESLIELEALGEAELKAKLHEARFLFLPTGSLQELSIENGWGEEFLVLASQLDEALGGPIEQWGPK